MKFKDTIISTVFKGIFFLFKKFFGLFIKSSAKNDKTDKENKNNKT